MAAMAARQAAVAREARKTFSMERNAVFFENSQWVLFVANGKLAEHSGTGGESERRDLSLVLISGVLPLLFGVAVVVFVGQNRKIGVDKQVKISQGMLLGAHDSWALGISSFFRKPS